MDGEMAASKNRRQLDDVGKLLPQCLLQMETQDNMMPSITIMEIPKSWALLFN